MVECWTKGDDKYKWIKEKWDKGNLLSVLQIYKNKKWPKFFFFFSCLEMEFFLINCISKLSNLSTHNFSSLKNVKKKLWKNSFAVVIWFIPSLCKFYHNFYHGNQSETGVIHRKHGSCIIFFMLDRVEKKEMPGSTIFCL